MRAVVAAIAWLAIGCGSTPPPPSDPTGAPAPLTDPADNCSAADDCDLVDACCGCNAGGKKIAIRKDAVAAFEASRPRRCGGQMCAQFISHDPSCDAEPVCGSRNRCRVMPHMQHQ